MKYENYTVTLFCLVQWLASLIRLFRIFVQILVLGVLFSQYGDDI